MNLPWIEKLNKNVVIDRCYLSNIIYRSIEENMPVNLHLRKLTDHPTIILTANDNNIILERFKNRKKEEFSDMKTYEKISKANELFKQALGYQIIIDGLTTAELLARVRNFVHAD